MEDGWLNSTLLHCSIYPREGLQWQEKAERHPENLYRGYVHNQVKD